MDMRAAKLALARKKLKDHQEKKQQDNTLQKEQSSYAVFDSVYQENSQTSDNFEPVRITQTERLDVNLNKNAVELKENDVVHNKITPDADVNATEILISSNRTLELQIHTLEAKCSNLENILTTTTQNYNDSCLKIANLENELKNTIHECQVTTEQLKFKDSVIKELNDSKEFLFNEKNSLQDQLDFSKSILATKEAENSSLLSQLMKLQTELDATQLHLQQLTSGAQTLPQDKTTSLKHENEVLLQKVSHLEHQLKIQIKDYQQLNNHYEHYVGELSDQLKNVTTKNEQLNREIQNLSNRENSLIEQISDMEIRIQNFKRADYLNTNDNHELKEMQENYEKAQQNLQELHSKYTELEKLYSESRAEVENLSHSNELHTQEASENVSLIKLNADITSDKIAAQRATEQNKKLKQDIHGLEDAFVKMTKDKLELTEKITAEKFLNRELTIKLAEIEEKAADMQKTLKAKDEEMIRLQTSYRIIEEKYQEIGEHLKSLSENPNAQQSIIYDDKVNGILEETETTIIENHTECDGHSSLLETENKKNALTECKHMKESGAIPKDDAMRKLQDRFLKIMDEVADLSDEKHRLEHIITQLQNETDTICEYVALYQQQRCLLKKRDEERSAQMQMFQSECTRLQNQLDELTGILTKFAEDKELSSYFQVETKHEDIQQVMKLLTKLKTNSLIDPTKSMKFNDFYPCSCCSGQLIEV